MNQRKILLIHHSQDGNRVRGAWQSCAGLLSAGNQACKLLILSIYGDKCTVPRRDELQPPTGFPAVRAGLCYILVICVGMCLCECLGGKKDPKNITAVFTDVSATFLPRPARPDLSITSTPREEILASPAFSSPCL
ncbi:hypothetical protein E2C01_020934 [Portunus trituberculatus]|uniref:Uncharacterized protein n=1 Tax=Portunus trituberculatus TaxID=210409 RepID=A0A5B7E3M2_PORTR|nr:hypothetical protein [Portunus trituberculatus]